VISCAPNHVEEVLATLRRKNIPHEELGEVTGDSLSINELSWEIAEIYDDWFNAIRRAAESHAEPVRSL
jgi:hypothetical protein